MLADIIESASRRGFIGRGSVTTAIEHARGFAAGVADPPPRLIDLGSGGGLPGLVLATDWPDTVVTLVDANQRRCEFLRDAVDRLGYDDRVAVVVARAEVLGHQLDFRAQYDVVTARSFGAPAVTAECAAPFLKLGGQLIVSEPPTPEGDRWPEDGLALLGLSLGADWTAPFRYRALVQRSLCPMRYPRRVGIPVKRPLF